MNSKIRSIIKDIRLGFLLLVGVVVFALMLRVFLFASFKIPSNSMYPAIHAGDYVIVNKLIIGPRIFKNFKWIHGKEQIKFNRVRGIRKVRRNDVLVFNFPYPQGWNRIAPNLNSYYVKRCVAIAGDTFYIKDGIYKVEGCADTLGNYVQQQMASRIKDEDLNEHVRNCINHWSMKAFGPLYVPKSNDTLAIDTGNIVYYRNLISYETSQTISIRADSVFLNNNYMTHYTFKNNYYFMAGDEVLDSQDSRYWGLLPEELIVGKVSFVWKSIDPNDGTWQWKRILKSVH